MKRSLRSIVDRRAVRGLTLALAVAFACSCASGEASSTSAAPAQQVPLMIRNGMPGEQHRWLDALAGDWNVEMSLFLAGGTPDKPHVGQNVVSRWRWLEKTGKRYMEEHIEGTMLGSPYYRLGVLGYANMDKRFEFSTFDQLNAGVMAYRGTGDQRQITMLGSFTDQGVLGDAYAGKTIEMRTQIRFETPDRNVFEIYFTPPGEPERLIDRKIYTRIK